MTDNGIKKMENFFYNRAGIHESDVVPIPKDRKQRIYYGMLEALGWDCIKYRKEIDGSTIPKWITEKKVERYLIKHKKKIKMSSIPDYLALMSGRYDFLKGD